MLQSVKDGNLARLRGCKEIASLEFQRENPSALLSAASCRPLGAWRMLSPTNDGRLIDSRFSTPGTGRIWHGSIRYVVLRSYWAVRPLDRNDSYYFACRVQYGRATSALPLRAVPRDRTRHGGKSFVVGLCATVTTPSNENSTVIKFPLTAQRRCRRGSGLSAGHSDRSFVLYVQLETTSFPPHLSAYSIKAG